MSKELGCLTQGFGTTNGTITVRFMDIEAIKHIPGDRVVTYVGIFVNCCPQKKDPNQVRIAVGDNLLKYPRKLTTRTLDLITSKVM